MDRHFQNFLKIISKLYFVVYNQVDPILGPKKVQKKSFFSRILYQNVPSRKTMTFPSELRKKVTTEPFCPTQNSIFVV